MAFPVANDKEYCCTSYRYPNYYDNSGTLEGDCFDGNFGACYPLTEFRIICYPYFEIPFLAGIRGSCGQYDKIIEHRLVNAIPIPLDLGC